MKQSWSQSTEYLESQTSQHSLGQKFECYKHMKFWENVAGDVTEMWIKHNTHAHGKCYFCQVRNLDTE